MYAGGMNKLYKVLGEALRVARLFSAGQAKREELAAARAAARAAAGAAAWAAWAAALAARDAGDAAGEYTTDRLMEYLEGRA